MSAQVSMSILGLGLWLVLMSTKTLVQSQLKIGSIGVDCLPFKLKGFGLLLSSETEKTGLWQTIFCCGLINPRMASFIRSEGIHLAFLLHS